MITEKQLIELGFKLELVLHETDEGVLDNYYYFIMEWDNRGCRCNDDCLCHTPNVALITNTSIEAGENDEWIVEEFTNRGTVFNEYDKLIAKIAEYDSLMDRVKWINNG